MRVRGPQRSLQGTPRALSVSVNHGSGAGCRAFCRLLAVWARRWSDVFGDEVKSVSVTEGDSVTLHTDITEIQTNDQILWMFGPKGTPIAQIYKKDIEMHDSTEIFGNRLKLDNQTASITITNITSTYSGLYELQILAETVIRLVIAAVVGVAAVTVVGHEIIDIRGHHQQRAIVKSVSVMEGDSVTLNTDITEIQTDQQILWKCESKGTIAKLFTQIIFSISDRLKLNNKTGSLTITNITITNSGLYKLQIFSNRGNSYKRFNITVYDLLPIPVIRRNSSQCPSSSSSVSKCVLLCSVFNVRDVSLSWYKENSLLSSISVSDLNIRLSLSLEVEYQDTNTYRCILNNTITNQTQHLKITDVCQMCSARLPVPVIMRNSSQCPSPSSLKCVLLCSVLNVRDVSLSWYKGNSLLSSISVSDLNIRLSLPLEVEYQDNNTYSCVVNNPITNQTQYFNITDVCQMCSAITAILIILSVIY
ncbi:titin-like [Misgurnus anguillicaudatus]|uniref:titin-like n=1 Tax=Misgurnus anguillicaudatus TaxID=75329 RepID=UPI003CCFA326